MKNLSRRQEPRLSGEAVSIEMLELSGDERQKHLVAGAKAKGSAIVYGNIPVSNSAKNSY